VFFFFSAMFIRAAKPTARMTPQRAMSTMGRVSSIVAVLVGWLDTFPEVWEKSRWVVGGFVVGKRVSGGGRRRK